MATFFTENLSIKGISCCVPLKKAFNTDLSIMTTDEVEKFINATGVEQRRIANPDICASDLCFAAAEDIIHKLDWNKKDIQVLIFVSQTPDYILPNTSSILQHKLGLEQSCITFDLTLGCSGYVYGLSVINSIMQMSGIKKGLLLVGDTISKIVSQTDKSTFPLFGDAGSATALEINPLSNTRLYFDLGSDGSGYKTIIIPDGGSRNRITDKSFKKIDVEVGIQRNSTELVLEGMDVFSFGITQVPKNINNLLTTFHIDKEEVDFFVFHQANLVMNKMIVKKLKIPSEKVPYSLREFGNTSSATIPLTITTELKEKIQGKNSNILMCGFGVGLSWGAVYIQNNSIDEISFIEI